MMIGFKSRNSCMIRFYYIFYFLLLMEASNKALSYTHSHCKLIFAPVISKVPIIRLGKNMKASNTLLATPINHGILLKSSLDYLRQEALASIISLEEVKAIVSELKSSPKFTDQIYQKYSILWDMLSNAVAKEKRSLNEILGPDSSKKILDLVDTIDVFEPNAVKTFLGSPVFESMLAGILYEGIFEFIQKVDILGNIVNGLPVIGPIRQAIMKEFKSNLDRSLGPQVKSFLSGSFNKIAVQRMVQFILSPSNQQSLRKANKNLAEFVLKRRFNSFFPEGDANIQLKGLLWRSVNNLSEKQISAFVDKVYEGFGDKKLEDILLLDYEQWSESSLVFDSVVKRNIQRFFNSPQGMICKQTLLQID